MASEIYRLLRGLSPNHTTLGQYLYSWSVQDFFCKLKIGVAFHIAVLL
jgi:hypothetical protein